MKHSKTIAVSLKRGRPARWAGAAGAGRRHGVACVPFQLVVPRREVLDPLDRLIDHLLVDVLRVVVHMRSDAVQRHDAVAQRAERVAHGAVVRERKDGEAIVAFCRAARSPTARSAARIEALRSTALRVRRRRAEPDFNAVRVPPLRRAAKKGMARE